MMDMAAFPQEEQESTQPYITDNTHLSDGESTPQPFDLNGLLKDIPDSLWTKRPTVVTLMKIDA